MTAASLAQAVAPAVLELAQAGDERPVVAVEIIEAPGPADVDRGDLVAVIGAESAADVGALIETLPVVAGVLLRRTWAEQAEIRALCAERDLPLLALADSASWSAAIAMLQRALAPAPAAEVGSSDQVYGDLFDMADKISLLLAAPITIEDATSHVLAYSSGQIDVDNARMSTIVGRRVPREVRDHFRSLGVFRRLMKSDEPFFVPAGAGTVKARYVIPVRAGTEWLGSIWAVVDHPVAPELRRELAAATEVVALYLLRLRSRAELHRQVQIDKVRALLRGGATERPGWLPDGPWQVATLTGPDDLLPAARYEVWLALCRRHGWRQPLLADLDGGVHLVLQAHGTVPGSTVWLRDLLTTATGAPPGMHLVLGGPVNQVSDLDRSLAEAVELEGILAKPDSGTREHVADLAASWAAVVLARAVNGVGERPLVSPLTELLARVGDAGAMWLDTLEAVIDFWGEPQRAAQRLGVHPNTVRYRGRQLKDLWPVDLDDPAARLAIRLELASLRARNR